VKRLALAAVAALAFAVLAAPAVSQNDNPKSTPTPKRCLPGAVRAYAAKVWDQTRWRRGDPKQAAVEGFRARLACAPAGSRSHLRQFWRSLQRDYYSARRVRLWRARVTPYYGCTSSGGCHAWAIPAYIVECESGGRYNDPSAPNGAYSLLSNALQGVPTWDTWRPASAAGDANPYEAPPKAQDIAAHRLWVAYGSEPWECA
jgi:hypothetical protein